MGNQKIQKSHIFIEVKPKMVLAHSMLTLLSIPLKKEKEEHLELNIMFMSLRKLTQV